jgi:hypothetical protein
MQVAAQLPQLVQHVFIAASRGLTTIPVFTSIAIPVAAVTQVLLQLFDVALQALELRSKVLPFARVIGP